MINRFYDRVERDAPLSPFFPGGVSAAHREHVTTWWCEVFGGPGEYTEKLASNPAMLAHHRDLDSTAVQRYRGQATGESSTTELPPTEFRAALVGYLEWGTGWPCTTPARRRRRAESPGTARAAVSPRPTSPTRELGQSAGLVLQGPLGEHAGQVLPVLLVGVNVLARLGAFCG